MRFTSVAAAVSTFVAAVSAADFNITVGKDGGKTFNPAQITGVQQGDVVRFQFVSGSHSATQSTFDQPCVSKPGGVDSGFLPATANATTFPEWSIQINNVSAPMWFYCARAPHCTGSGMVFAINPTANKTFAAYQAKATSGATNSPASSGATASTPSSTGVTSTPGNAGPGGVGGSSNSSSSNPNAAPGSASSTRSSLTLSVLAGAAVVAGLWL
ncbi:hypothetical protein CPB83DRAFT_859423 [Crepidotus variabilis]|uniref:Extracellular serine-rich protein n=1 Tax=Crepidotus variabilis TaxID=179855 RepID=A0A9P6EAK1_9AGAR|nr:hypothetical protein CPB83DRAFT_859423 [Crepidotus variabilis]